MSRRGGPSAPVALRLLLFALFVPLLAPTARAAPAQPPPVVRLSIHDTVQPVSEGYLRRGLEEAARRHAALVLVSLGTPGGLLSSTRSMMEAIEASPVPVAIYIEPPGSRAGSAGFFLLQAADVAAMAPGTNAGAAHPVGGGTTEDAVMREKVENDAAALLRASVLRRGRNVEAAEAAVRHSVSYSDAEALERHLIDLVAPSEADLLRALDGRSVRRFDGSTAVLHTRGAEVLRVGPSLRERLLARLVNPDLAVALLILGALLLYVEFNVPGTIVPGSVGALLLLLGAFGLNLLPVRHTAVFLIVAALALFVLEAKFASHGVLAIAGVLALIFGLATLVDAPAPELRVHLAVALAAGVGFGGISAALAWFAFRARRGKVLTGPEALLGQGAIASTALGPGGQVEIRGELWQAELAGAVYAAPGSAVRVRSVEGLLLRVEPVDGHSRPSVSSRDAE